jgi:hypothetical protein
MASTDSAASANQTSSSAPAVAAAPAKAPRAKARSAKQVEQDAAATAAAAAAAAAARPASAAQLLSVGARKLQSVCDARLLGSPALCREATMLLSLLTRLAAMLPRGGEAAIGVANWALKALKAHTVADARAVRALARLAVALRPAPQDAQAALTLARAAQELTGSLSVSGQTDGENGWRGLSRATVGAAALGLLAVVDASLEDLEWLLSSLKSGGAAAHAPKQREDSGGDRNEDDDDDAEEEREEQTQRGGATAAAAAVAALARREALLCCAHARMAELDAVLALLLECRLPLTAGESLLRLTTRLAALVTAACVAALAPRGCTQPAVAASLRTLVYGIEGGVRDRAGLKAAYEHFVTRFMCLKPARKEPKTGANKAVKKAALKKGAGSAKKRGRREEEEDADDAEVDSDTDADAAAAASADEDEVVSAATLDKLMKLYPLLDKQWSKLNKALHQLDTATKKQSNLLRYSKRTATRDFKLSIPK